MIRFTCSVAVLLLPTTMMGATVPLAVKAVLGPNRRVDDEVAVLYAANTAGAIAGTFAAGFWLIGQLGVAASFRLAAAVNIAVACGAVAISSWVQSTRQHESEAPHASIGASPEVVTGRGQAAVLAVFGVSGFASLALELIWFRVLVLITPVTIYAFAVMLATVLLGIAVGSAAAGLLLRWRRDLIATLARLELLTAIATVASLITLAGSYGVFDRVQRLVGQSLDEFAFVPLFLAAAVAILPTTILLGAAFPIGIRIWTGGSSTAAEQGRRVGYFYAVNLAAAIGGSIAGGFLLLPHLGSRVSLLVLASAILATGLWLLRHLPHRRRLALVEGFLAVGLFAVAAATAPDPVTAIMAKRHGTERLFWHEEGIETTASIHLRPMGGMTLYLNGMHQADDSPGMIALHRQIGQLPLALHPAPKEALVVGLGGGATAGAVSEYPGVSVDLVELSNTVVHAADWFRHINADVVHRPNVRLHVDDGRNYLLLGRKRYDVITADIVQPVHAGAGNLYSAEYFQLAREALNDDGLMLQWIDQRNAAQYLLILRTFTRVFPDTTLWVDGRLMLGSKRPFRVNADRVREKLTTPALQPFFESMGVGSLESLLALYTAGPEEIRRFVGDGPILSDDRPTVEYFLSVGGDRGRMIDLRELRGDVHRILPGGAN